MTIRFGTDGWRGVMNKDFTIDRVKVVAQAIADYVISRGLAKYGVVIGYDSRRNSEQYARACIEVLAGNSVPVYLMTHDVPTPAVAFATVKLRAGGAVMITASHNPPEYNGVKFIPHYGGPALTEITQEIEEQIPQVKVRSMDVNDADRRGLVAYIDFKEDYIDWVISLVDVDAVRRANLKVLVNPLHGSTIGFLDEALMEAGCEVKRMRCDKDPSFGGRMPDPTSPEVIDDMRFFMQDMNVGLATDGDGDRASAYSRTYISPNMLFPILFKAMLDKGIKGGIVRTVATTHMVDEVAIKSGLRVYEVPVGFKNIAPHLLMGEAVMGGEESGGFGYKWHIPEKDGILTCLYVVEALALTGKRRLEDLIDEMSKEYKILYSLREKVEDVDRQKLQELKGALEGLEPENVEGFRVEKISRIDGAKFITEKGWLLIRPSGTEPIVRVYAESDDPELARKFLEWGLSRVRKMTKAR